jgi:hypothetical protein
MDQSTATPVTRLRLNPVGIAVVILGALVAVIAIFLPLVSPPNGIPITGNTVLQGQSGLAFRYVILGVIAAGLLWRYHQRGKVTWGLGLAGALLIIGAIVDGNNDSYFALTYSSPFGSAADLGLDSATGSAGLGIYAAGAAGVLVLIGWTILRSHSENVTVEPATSSRVESLTPAGVAEQLERLASLHAGRQISDSEYADAKQRVLAV